MAAPPHAWYALRRTLPPWRFEETLAELLRCVRSYNVDEVIIKVDTEEFTHGHPPMGWVKRYMPKLHRAADALRAAGVVYSLNPWISVGHCDRGRDGRRQIPQLQTMVGDNGVRCACCACPLDEAWRAHVENVWTLYARTRPHVMWIEDDIRTFNHEPIQFGCFCPIHTKRFSRAVGREVTREQLLAALLAPGRPHRWRKAWLDMQRDVMNETVAFLAKVVHRVSSDSCMGLMSSGPRAHVLCGRDWTSFCTALADGRPLYSRPPMGNYAEGPLRGFYYSHDSIKITRSCCPPGTIEQTEVENVPFTRYANSITFTFIEMAISFAYGSRGVTMNLFDHSGTPMEDEPHFGRMLAAKKPFLSALAKVAQQPGSYRGVRLLHHDRNAYAKRITKGADRYGTLGEDGGQAGGILEPLGIATTYEDAAVVAADGQVMRAFSDDEIRDMLRGGLLIDAAAACVLVERGFARQIGLRDIERPRCVDDIEPLSAEELIAESFGGAPRTYMTLTLPDLMGRPSLSILLPSRGATVVSRIVDADTKARHVGMTAFENRLGGRVVIHALQWAGAVGEAFFTPARQRQFQNIVTWLARRKPPLLTNGDGVYPLAFRKDLDDGRTLLGMFNLTLDPWPNVEFALADTRRVANLRILTPAGRWVACKALTAVKRSGQTTIRYRRPVALDTPLFIRVDWRR